MLFSEGKTKKEAESERERERTPLTDSAPRRLTTERKSLLLGLELQTGANGGGITDYNQRTRPSIRENHREIGRRTSGELE